MSMDPYLFGYRDRNNEHHQKMLKIRHACEEADITMPDEVNKYFDDGDDDDPLRVELETTELDNGTIELKVSDIPVGVSLIRMEWL